MKKSVLKYKNYKLVFTHEGESIDFEYLPKVFKDNKEIFDVNEKYDIMDAVYKGLRLHG